jgi:hypothetical protein
LYAHSNIGLFSARESHPFAHRHAGDSRRWVAIEPTKSRDSAQEALLDG